MQRTLISLLLAAASAIATAGLAAAGELEDVVALALRDNPQVAAAREAVLRTEAGRLGLRGFYAPQATAASGWNRAGRSVPGVPGEVVLPDDAASFLAGVETAVRPGAYIGVGAGERYLIQPEGFGDYLYQPVAGVQVRIPLLKDRGFRQWKEQNAGADAEYNAAVGRLLRICQDLQRDVEDRYFQHMRSRSDLDIARAATARAQSLLTEADQLVELKMLPPHQLYPARLELALRQEEETAAVSAAETSRRRVRELAGAVALAADRTQTVDLVTWAGASELPKPPDGFLMRRGVYLEGMAAAAAAEAALRQAVDTERSDLSLRTVYTWQGEDESNPFGTEPLLTDSRSGVEVSLVWKRALGSRSERARIEAARAQVRELRESLRSIEWRIAAERDVAAQDFGAASARLKLMSAAVQDARDALGAEEERFRLGDGTSRQVLDAQKDLTAAIRRQNDIAADVLRVRSVYLYAVGLTGAAGAGGGENGRSKPLPP